MDTLSAEILITIFEFLPLRTIREKIRLVCRKWNEASQFSGFTKKEKIIFFHDYNIGSVSQYSDFHQRKILHLHFHRQEIFWNDAEISFWKSCGERVHSIHLEHCSFSFSDLMMILKLCPSLSSIHYQNKHELLEDFYSRDELNFVAPSVTSFRFSHECEPWLLNNHSPIMETVRKMLAMFPNLINLQINLTLDNTHSAYAFMNMFCSLDVVEQLEKLSFKMHFRRYFQHMDCTLFKSHLQNLKKLHSFTSSYTFVDEIAKPLDPLFELANIFSLDLTLDSDFEKSFPNLILHALEKFTNLHRLQLRRLPTINLDDIAIQKLLSSKLELLHLSFYKLILDANVKVSNDFKLNKRLVELSLRCLGHRNDHFVHLVFIFMTYFRSIEMLTLDRWNSAVLRQVVKYQNCLRILRLCGDNWSHCPRQIFHRPLVTDSINAESGQTRTYFSNLSNLRSLTIQNAVNIDAKTLAIFCSPKLTKIKLRDITVSPTELTFLAANCPLLEKINLRVPRKISQEQLENILRPLKYIRLVRIEDDYSRGKFQRLSIESCTDYNYKKLFEIFPSLKNFIHNNVWFYINVLNKELEAWQYPASEVVPYYMRY